MEKEVLADLRKACENTGVYRACERSVDWLEKNCKKWSLMRADKTETER